MTENKDEILDALNEEATSGSQDTLDSMWDIDETGLNEALGLETAQADPILDIDEKKPEAKKESKKEVTEEVTEKTEEKIEEPEFDEDSTGEKEEIEVKTEEKEPKKETSEETEEPDKDGNLSCKFDYILHDNPNNLEEDQDMLNYMGDILVDVIDEELKIEDNFNNIDIPLAPEEVVKGIIDNHTATGLIRDNAEELKDILSEEPNDNE